MGSVKGYFEPIHDYTCTPSHSIGLPFPRNPQANYQSYPFTPFIACQTMCEIFEYVFAYISSAQTVGCIKQPIMGIQTVPRKTRFYWFLHPASPGGWIPHIHPVDRSFFRLLYDRYEDSVGLLPHMRMKEPCLLQNQMVGSHYLYCDNSLYQGKQSPKPTSPTHKDYIIRIILTLLFLSPISKPWSLWRCGYNPYL